MAKATGTNNPDQGFPTEPTRKPTVSKANPDGPIPQKWLDEILNSTKNQPALFGKVVQAITSSSTQVISQLKANEEVLNNLSNAIGANFEVTFVNALKKYTKEFQEKEDDRVYDKRKKEKDNQKVKDDKKLVEDLGKTISESATGKAAKTEIPPATIGLPVHLQSINEAVIVALKGIFAPPAPKVTAPEPGKPGGGAEVNAITSKSPGFFGKLGEGLAKLGTPEALRGAATLALLGVSVLTAAKGFQAFATVTWEGMGKGFLTLLGLIGITKLLALSSVEMLIGAAAITALGAALWLVAKGLGAFAAIDWSSILKGAVALIGLSAFAVELGAFAEFAVLGAAAIALLGIAIIPFSLSMMLLAKALDMFAKVEWESIHKGVLALAGLGAVATMLSPFAVMLGVLGLAMLPFSLAIMGLAKGLQMFAEVQWSSIFKGMLAIAALGEAALFLAAGPLEGLLLLGLALLPFSLAVMALAKGLQMFSDVEWGGIMKGIFALTLFGTVGAVIGILSPLLLVFGLSLIPFGIGMMSLAKGLQMFSDVEWGGIMKGIFALMLFGTVGAVIGILSPLLVIFGVALIPFSIGMMTLAKSLQMFSEVNMAGIDLGLQALRKIALTGSLLGVFAPLLALFGVALLPFSLGLYTLGNAINSLASVNYKGVDDAMLALIKLAGIGSILGILSPLLALFGVALLPFSLGLYTFGMAVNTLASVGFEGVDASVDAINRFASIGLVTIAKLGLLGVALTPFSLGLYALGKAAQAFGTINFGAIDKGIISLLRFTVVAKPLTFIAPYLIAAAAGMTIFGIAAPLFASGLNAVNDPLERFSRILQVLNTVSALNLFELSGAVVALGASLIALSAQNAVAGIGNLVSGLFSKVSGSKSPLDQLIAIGEQASNIQQVAGSIGALKESLAGFGDIKFSFTPLTAFIDTINKVSLPRAIALATTLSVGAAVTARATEPVPVSIVSTELAAGATKEANNLNNLTTGASIPYTESPIDFRKYNDNLERVVDSLNNLAKVMKAEKSSTNLAANNATTTAISNNSNIVLGGGSNSERDIPYIERNKYRQNIMYTRSLL